MHIGIKMKGTWRVAEAPETNKTTPRSISGPLYEWILASCWISNMLISTKPWKAIGPPKSDNHNNSNYSDVKDFDGNSYIQHGCSVQLGSDTILDTLYHFSLVAIWQFFLSTFPLHFEFTQVQKPCSTWVLDNSRRVGMAGHSAGPRCRDRGIWPANTLWVYFGIWVWVNTYRYIFSGMNIHLPAILGFTRYQGFDPSPYHYFYPKHSSSEPF